MSDEREGTPEEVARMLRGEQPNEEPPESEQSHEDWLTAVFTEKYERDRALIESLHPQPKQDP